MKNRIANILTAVDMAAANGLDHAADWLRRQAPEHFETIDAARAAIENPPAPGQDSAPEGGDEGAGKDAAPSEPCTGEEGTAVAGAAPLVEAGQADPAAPAGEGQATAQEVAGAAEDPGAAEATAEPAAPPSAPETSHPSETTQQA
jgi:hypothetical protein